MNVHDEGLLQKCVVCTKLDIDAFIIVAIRLWKYANKMHDTKQL